MPRPEGVEIKRSYQIRELTKAINGPRKTGMSGRTESLLNVPKKAPGRIFPVSERRSVKKGRQKNVQGGEGEGGEGKKKRRFESSALFIKGGSVGETQKQEPIRYRLTFLALFFFPRHALPLPLSLRLTRISFAAKLVS
jgi:hypothetical protein